MTKILIIDDEPQIQKFLRISLASQQYQVVSAENGRDGIAQAILARPDLIILDLGLPDMDGKYVLQKIVAETFAPVIVLSVRSLETEKVACLDMGALDYVEKPFSVNELLARIRRVMSTSRALQNNQDAVFDDGNLRVEQHNRKVLLGQKPVALTKKEWAVLRQLIGSPGRLVTQATLLQHIWGKSHMDDTQYLRNIILKLRQKLGDNAANPRYIETEPGVGYRFIPMQEND